MTMDTLTSNSAWNIDTNKGNGYIATQVSSNDIGQLYGDVTCNKDTCRIRNLDDCLTENIVEAACGSIKMLFNPINLLVTLIALFIRGEQWMRILTRPRGESRGRIFENLTREGAVRGTNSWRSPRGTFFAS
ncbi:unnamed protein product [Didymodactylos carnosus]|uniref:Uncharacterized protein n=1 Tax=Didymodactylos carnosus TaxID=1234261 RepID=A0A814F263_9BILA|nr:unnamed protein product [Didymodactylos carnosus]CAF1338990.1 unnamed protein product [Didymodactylos carnosus]CAF3746898.1 unnamed protein product [Didymodactylos carnosus]CAF4150240.1 unnamed protein product [Didymodactylos carnosus]